MRMPHRRSGSEVLMTSAIKRRALQTLPEV